MTAEELKAIFAKRLKLYMENAEENQDVIAKVCGVSQQTVSDWLNAKKYPRMDKVGILAEHFNVPISSLVDDGKTESIIINNELREMATIFNSLPSEDQKFVLQFLLFLSKRLKNP